MAIRILIADDHPLLRAGLRSLMVGHENLVVVGEAMSGKEAVEGVQLLHPDIVLMDIGMPGNEKLESTREVIKNYPESKVMILSMHEEYALIQECLRAGVSGYIVKRAAESELIDAIYAVHRGLIYVHPTLIRTLVGSPAEAKKECTVKYEELTRREKEVLRFVALGQTNRQIAQELKLSVRTIETHRGHIMEKLDLHSRADLVRFAYEHKLIEHV